MTKYLYIRSPILKILIGIASLLIAFAVILLTTITEDPRMELQTLNWEARSIENGAALYANNCTSCHGADGKGLPGVAPALQSHYFFTQRVSDVGYLGSLDSYVLLTIAAGRPSKAKTQWAQVMPTWGNAYGGPMRADQVQQVADYVMNFRDAALAQTAEEDPWQAFRDVTKAPEAQTIGDFVPAEAVEVSTGPRTPAELWGAGVNGMACLGCHNLALDQTADSRGPVGPNMKNLYERAGSVVPGMDAQTYVHTSIVDPNAHLADGYVGGIMTANFAERMSEDEINSLVEWLLDPDRVE
ncbi:MAG: cytochrome c [Caldilineaceae bacterium]|nr:cytochrome c [Caldilineaceae bacterium]MBP8108595.1 cytochrome c [Caldilineaceae bacterium]MBP8121273.1 cytochrome c [Caldilineaceae bacterium]MBP9070839.1 cytochrome c [Caldilineaceae bacterium]